MQKTHISSTELARSVGEVLSRVRYAGETFAIERNGRVVAWLTPVHDQPHGLAEALSAWLDAGSGERDFADALEQVGHEDRPLESPWA